MNRRLSQKSEKVMLVMIFVYNWLLQLFVVPNLPAKYFYDSNTILKFMNYTSSQLQNVDNAYSFTAKFFNVINIFRFDTFYQWSILITFLMTFFVILFIKKFHNIEIHKLVFLFVTLFFCNIYAFRISKEFIQLLFWIIVYYIYKQTTGNKRIFITFLILIIEGFIFRNYFFVLTAFFILIYFILLKVKKIKLYYFVLAILGLIASLYLLNVFSPQIYTTIINLRQSLNKYRTNSLDAITIINDIFRNTNPIMYAVNYTINGVRMLFPFELLSKGIKYIPFIVYQVYYSINILKYFKNNVNSKDSNKIYILAILMSHFFVSVLFEPDFGSFIRHEVSLFPIMIIMVFYSNKILKEEK